MPFSMSDMSSFAQTVLANKYFRGDESSWEEVAYRVASTVVGPFYPDKVEVRAL